MMKRVTTVFMVLFWLSFVAIILWGIASHLFSNNTASSRATAPGTTVNLSTLRGVTLDVATVSRHNSMSSCWMIIDNKVYDITSYFGSHPGGDAIMVNFCGKEASNAYHLSPHRHSSYASGLLSRYLVGDMGSTVRPGSNSGATPANTNTGVNSTASPSQNNQYEDD